MSNHDQRPSQPSTPLVGYRIWLINDGKLKSLTMDTVWEPGQAMKAKMASARSKYIEYASAIMIAVVMGVYATLAGNMFMAIFAIIYGLCTVALFWRVLTRNGEFAHSNGGVHAYKDNANCKWVLSAFDPKYICVGEVWLWGTVIEHEDGWRAQYAYPKEIYGRPDLTALYADAAGYNAERSSYDDEQHATGHASDGIRGGHPGKR